MEGDNHNYNNHHNYRAAGNVQTGKASDDENKKIRDERESQ